MRRGPTIRACIIQRSGKKMLFGATIGSERAVVNVRIVTVYRGVSLATNLTSLQVKPLLPTSI